MKQKAFAIAGGILLAVVAAFTLINLAKAAIGLAVIFFAGRGLMRLWMGGNRHRHQANFQGQMAYPSLGGNSRMYPVQGMRPLHTPAPQASGIIPIW